MIDKKDQRTDVIIVGGGLAGLALASILGQQGIDVALVEPNPPNHLLKDAKPSGRTVALMQSSLNVLKAAGLENFCEEHGTKMEVMRIIDDSVQGQKTLQLEFEAHDIGLEYFSMNIPNNPLRTALYKKVQTFKNVTIHTSRLKDFKVERNILATFEDNTQISAPLIIGADGRQSLVRSLSGIKTWKKDYGQSAMTCIINHSRAHHYTSTEFHRPSGPFALVPLQGNQSSVVWVEKTDKAEEFIALSRNAFEQALQERTNNTLGGITLETNPECWSLCTIKAKSLTAPRTALIAEAAHVMSPITAQGLNLSLRDVATLAETIIDAMRLGLDHGNHATLRIYESRRSLDIGTRVLGVNSMNQLVSNNNTAIKDLRRAGLKLMGRFSPLKNLVMNYGLAPTQDQGQLAQGYKI